MTTNDSTEYKRPLSVPHLVFGLVFGGIATVWFIGQATNADLPRSAVGFPVVLIGAGIIGLVASLAGSRRRSQVAAAEYAAYRAAYDAHYAVPAQPDVDAVDETPETTAETTDDTVVLDAPAPTDPTTEEKS